MNRQAIAVLLASTFTAAAHVSAQVSGSWVGPSGASWSIGSNWTSNPQFPSNGGTAVFANSSGTILLDVNATLSVLRFNTPYAVSIGTSGFTTNMLTFTGPALVEVAALQKMPPGTTAPIGHQIYVPVSTPGFNDDIHFSGPGSMVLRANSSGSLYGNEILDSGINLGIITGSAFGSSGSVIMNSATIRTLTNSGGTSSFAATLIYPILVQAGGATFETGLSPLGVGSLTGSGPVTLRGDFGVQLNNVSDYSGDMRVMRSATFSTSGVTLLSWGGLPGYNSLTVGSSFTVDDIGTVGIGGADRLSDGTIALRGGSLTLNGFANAPGNEHIGTLIVQGGNNVLTVAAKSNQTLTITSTALARSDRGTMMLRGSGVGTTSGSLQSRIFFDWPASVPLVGGGGAAGTPDVSIVPFIVPDPPASSEASFATYDANGLRPLAANEYTQIFATASPTANLRNMGANVTTPRTVNSLHTTSMSGTSTLTVTSGAIFGGNNSCPIDFGSAEGFVTSAPINSQLSGTNGVTFNGVCTLSSSTASTYTGQTAINSGTVSMFLDSNLVAGVPGPFGADTSPVVLVGRGIGARLNLPSSPIRSFARELLVRSDPDTVKGLEPLLTGSFNMTGKITLEGPLRVDPGVQLTGPISGPGRLDVGTVFSPAFLVVTGNNTFSGGVDLGVGSIIAGSNTALGTGTLFVGDGPGAGTIGALGISMSGPVSRTLANPVVLFDNFMLFDPNNGSINLTGPIDLNFGTRRISAQGAFTTFSGNISNGDLTWAGGRGTLSGDNSQRSTLVNTGRLRITSDHGLGNAPLATTVGTTLLSGLATLELSNEVTIPTHPLTMNANTLRNVSGNNIWSGSITALSTSSIELVAGLITVQGGITGGAAPSILSTSGPATLTTRFIRTPGELRMLGGTTRILADGSDAATSNVATLTISPGAALDLTDNDAVIDYTGANPIDSIRAMLIDHRITSSLADASVHTLGYAENALSGLAVFSGQSVDTTSVLIKYTWFGDSDLDGDVDIADLGNLASNWQASGVWNGGDFDYTGSVDVNDLGLLASNWQAGVGNPLGPSLQDTLASLGLPGASTPEPACLAGLGAGLAMLLAHRRRPAR